MNFDLLSSSTLWSTDVIDDPNWFATTMTTNRKEKFMILTLLLDAGTVEKISDP